MSGTAIIGTDLLICLEISEKKLVHKNYKILEMNKTSFLQETRQNV